MKENLYNHTARIVVNNLLEKYSEGIELNHSGQNKIFIKHLVVSQPNIYKEKAESLRDDAELEKYASESDLGYISQEVSGLSSKNLARLEKLSDQYIKQYAKLRIKDREPNYVSYEKQVYNLDRKFHDDVQEYGVSVDNAFQLMTVLKLNSLYTNIIPYYEGKAEPEYLTQTTLEIGDRRDTAQRDVVRGVRSQINREAIFILNNHSENILVRNHPEIMDNIGRALVTNDGKQALEITEIDSVKDFDPRKLQRFIGKIINNDLILSLPKSQKLSDRELWDSIIDGIEDNYNLGNKIAQSSMANIKEATTSDVIDIRLMQGYLDEYKEQSLALLLSKGGKEENKQTYTDRSGTNKKVESFLGNRGIPKERIKELSSYLKSIAYEESFDALMQMGGEVKSLQAVSYIPEEYQSETPEIMAPLFQRTKKRFESHYEDLWVQNRSKEETARIRKEGSKIPEQFRDILMNKGISRDSADYFTMSVRFQAFTESVKDITPEEMGKNSVIFNARLRKFIKGDDNLQTRLREAEEEIVEDIEGNKVDIEYNSPPRIMDDSKRQELINYSVKGLTNYYGEQIRDSIDAALKANNARISEEYSIAKKGLQSSLNGILEKEEIKSRVKDTVVSALEQALEMNKDDPSINTDTLQKVEKSLRIMQK